MRKCPSCSTPIQLRFYLCWTCWTALPVDTRRALNRRDSSAFRRLQQLLDHLNAGVPLHEITITEPS
jgi:hypothetical protein